MYTSTMQPADTGILQAAAAAASPSSMQVIERLVKGAPLRPASAQPGSLIIHTTGPSKQKRPASGPAQRTAPPATAQKVALADVMQAEEAPEAAPCRGTLPFLACTREKAQGVGFQAVSGSGPPRNTVTAVSYSTQDRHVPTFSWVTRPATAGPHCGGSRKNGPAASSSGPPEQEPPTTSCRSSGAGLAATAIGSPSSAADHAGTRSSVAGARSTTAGARLSEQDDAEATAAAAAAAESPLDLKPCQLHKRKRPTTAFFRSMPRPSSAPATSHQHHTAAAAVCPSPQVVRPQSPRGLRFAAQTARPTPAVQSTWPGPGQYNPAQYVTRWVKSSCARGACTQRSLTEADLLGDLEELPWLRQAEPAAGGANSDLALNFLRNERRQAWTAVE